MYNGGNQQNGLYVPPAFRRGGGNNGGGGQQQQRGGGGPRPNNNYGGRFSYDQRPNPHEAQFQHPPPPRPNFGQQNVHPEHQQRGGHRQPYAGRFSYDQRNTHGKNNSIFDFKKSQF